MLCMRISIYQSFFIQIKRRRFLHACLLSPSLITSPAMIFIYPLGLHIIQLPLNVQMMVEEGDMLGFVISDVVAWSPIQSSLTVFGSWSGAETIGNLQSTNVLFHVAMHIAVPSTISIPVNFSSK